MILKLIPVCLEKVWGGSKQKVSMATIVQIKPVKPGALAPISKCLLRSSLNPIKGCL